MEAQTNVPDGIIEKIQKIQALADNAGTEFEAALAAERVAELCRRHNLDIGVARLEREETEASEAVHGMNSTRWAAHWSALSVSCEKLFGVGVYKKSGYRVRKNLDGVIVGQEKQIATVFYGLKASVASATVTYEYLLASVEAMLEGWINAGNLTDSTDRRSFRLGCSRRIFDEAVKVHNASVNLLQSGDSLALVRLENALVQSHSRKMRLRKGSGYAGAANRDAYGAGYRAGGQVDLHGARSSRMLSGVSR